jgi:hypothetical protein
MSWVLYDELLAKRHAGDDAVSGSVADCRRLSQNRNNAGSPSTATDNGILSQLSQTGKTTVTPTASTVTAILSQNADFQGSQAGEGENPDEGGGTGALPDKTAETLRQLRQTPFSAGTALESTVSCRKPACDSSATAATGCDSRAYEGTRPSEDAIFSANLGSPVWSWREPDGTWSTRIASTPAELAEAVRMLRAWQPSGRLQ